MGIFESSPRIRSSQADHSVNSVDLCPLVEFATADEIGL